MVYGYGSYVLHSLHMTNSIPVISVKFCGLYGTYLLYKLGEFVKKGKRMYHVLISENGSNKTSG